MKRLLLSLLFCTHAFAITRSLDFISAPSSVTSGQSFSVTAAASTDASDGEQIGFLHGQYSTDGGSNWTWFCGDTNVGGYAARNAWVTAGAAGSTVIVRVRAAFRGGTGDYDYAGGGIDWGGSWDSWQTPPTKYVYISVVAPPNQPPTVTWVQNPSAAYINQSFSVQARADDGDGNLSAVWVWKEGVPFAVNGGGNGYQSYSDANSASLSTVGSVNFSAQSFDGNGASSAVIYHTVTINNRAPFVTLSLVPSTISFGQSTTFSSTITDADGNLAAHAILRHDGANWRRPTGTNFPLTGCNVYSEDSVGWSALNSLDDSATGYSNVKSGNYRPQSAIGCYFHGNGFDVTGTYASNWVSVQLVVNKATPTGTFASRTIAPTTTTYSVIAADLNAAFANPYSTQVAIPTGTVTYAIVGPGTAVTAGTTLTTGNTYTIRASYPGDSNYNAATIDATWTISTANLDSDGDGLSDQLEGQLGTNSHGSSSNGSDTGNSAALKIHKPQ